MDSSEMGKYIIAITILFSLLLKYQCEVIVAQDGSGNFKRINDAIRAAPINSSKKFLIRIKIGIYKETVVIEEEKKNIFLVGDGMENTIISGKRSLSFSHLNNTWLTSTVRNPSLIFVTNNISFGL